MAKLNKLYLSIYHISVCDYYFEKPLKITVKVYLQVAS